MTFLLHHQVYNPADVIWDADDWSTMTDTAGDPNLCSYCNRFAHNGPCETEHDLDDGKANIWNSQF